MQEMKTRVSMQERKKNKAKEGIIQRRGFTARTQQKSLYIIMYITLCLLLADAEIPVFPLFLRSVFNFRDDATAGFQFR